MSVRETEVEVLSVAVCFSFDSTVFLVTPSRPTEVVLSLVRVVEAPSAYAVVVVVSRFSVAFFSYSPSWRSTSVAVPTAAPDLLRARMSFIALASVRGSSSALRSASSVLSCRSMLAMCLSTSAFCASIAFFVSPLAPVIAASSRGWAAASLA